MSVERIQLLHEDYIRLTERFKACVDVSPVSPGHPEDVLRDGAGVLPRLRQALRRRARRGRRDRHDVAGEGRPANPRARGPARRVRPQAPRGRPAHLAVLRPALLREGAAAGREDRVPPPALLLLSARRGRRRRGQGGLPRDGRGRGPARGGRSLAAPASRSSQVLRVRHVGVRLAPAGLGVRVPRSCEPSTTSRPTWPAPRSSRTSSRRASSTTCGRSSAAWRAGSPTPRFSPPSRSATCGRAPSFTGSTSARSGASRKRRTGSASSSASSRAEASRVPSAEEFRKFRESRDRYERQIARGQRQGASRRRAQGGDRRGARPLRAGGPRGRGHRRGAGARRGSRDPRRRTKRSGGRTSTGSSAPSRSTTTGAAPFAPGSRASRTCASSPGS